MSATQVSVRRRLGALVTFYDLPAVQVWVAAAALGVVYSIQTTGMDGSHWLVALFSMGLLFMYLMGINDTFDVQIDSQKHEHSGLVTGVLTRDQAALAMVLAGGVGLAGSWLVSRWFFAFAVVIFLLSTLYSAPPVRYKMHYPFSTLGELAGGYLLFLLGMSVASVPTFLGCVVSLIPALIAASMRLGHEAKYVEFDRQTGKRTLAVVHGEKVVGKVVKVLPYAAVALVAALFAIQVIGVTLALFCLAFVLLPQLVRKTIRASRHLRPVSYFWGFLFYLLAVLL